MLEETLISTISSTLIYVVCALERFNVQPRLWIALLNVELKCKPWLTLEEKEEEIRALK